MKVFLCRFVVASVAEVELAALDGVPAKAQSIVEFRPEPAPRDTAPVVSITKTRAKIADVLGLVWLAREPDGRRTNSGRGDFAPVRALATLTAPVWWQPGVGSAFAEGAALAMSLTEDEPADTDDCPRPTRSRGVVPAVERSHAEAARLAEVRCATAVTNTRPFCLLHSYCHLFCLDGPEGIASSLSPVHNGRPSIRTVCVSLVWSKNESESGSVTLVSPDTAGYQRHMPGGETHRTMESSRPARKNKKMQVVMVPSGVERKRRNLIQLASTLSPSGSTARSHHVLQQSDLSRLPQQILEDILHILPHCLVHCSIFAHFLLDLNDSGREVSSLLSQFLYM